MMTQKLIMRKQELEGELESIQKQLSLMPEGSVFCVTINNHPRYYHRTDGNEHYLPKTQQQLAEKLAYKKYLTCRQKDLLQELSAIDSYLKKRSKAKNTSEHFLSNPAYRDLLSPFFQSKNITLSEWEKESYNTNPKYPEQLRIKSPSGNVVRSKSELLIDMTLFQQKIPFRYECELKLNSVTLYPDFTIKRPADGKIFYWEHFGMVDHPSYAKEAFKKQELFCSHNIFPGFNLITTYETWNQPLTPDTVYGMIQLYLL